MKRKLIYFSGDSNQCKFLAQPGPMPAGDGGKGRTQVAEIHPWLFTRGKSDP